MPNNLKALRNTAKLTQAQLAQRIGMSREGYLKIESGIRDLTLKRIEKIAAVLSIDPGKIVTDNLEDDEVPLVGRVRSGGFVQLKDRDQAPFEHVEAPDGARPETVAIEVSEGGMGQAYFDGMVVYYDDTEPEMSANLIGKLCVVGLPGGEVVLAKITRSRAGGGLYHLEANPPILDTRVKWVSPVRGIFPRHR